MKYRQREKESICSLFSFLSVSLDGFRFRFFGQEEGDGRSLAFISHVINAKLSRLLSEGVETITLLKTRDV